MTPRQISLSGHPFYNNLSSILGHIFTSECVERTLYAAAPQEELGSHGDQGAARNSALVAKEDFQSREGNLNAGQNLHHSPTLLTDRWGRKYMYLQGALV
jgi:hypothetical protein